MEWQSSSLIQAQESNSEPRVSQPGVRGAGRGRHRHRIQYPLRQPLSSDGQPHPESHPETYLSQAGPTNYQVDQHRASAAHRPDFSRAHNDHRSRGRFRNHRRGNLNRHNPSAYDGSANESQATNSTPNVSESVNQENAFGGSRGRGRGRGGVNSRHRNIDMIASSQQNDTDYEPQRNNEVLVDVTSAQDILNDQSQISESQLKGNKFECMICCDNISRYHPIWYCGNCYNIFHLKCAVEWCNKSIKSRNEAIANSQYPSLSQNESRPAQTATITGLLSGGPSDNFGQYQHERMSSVEWPCPTCREVLHSRPGKYKCFCGKVVKPEINKLLTPHSCGQLCGKKRPNSDCPHTCNAICHPGRCAQCPLTSKKPCFCGKLIRDIKCSISTSSCELPCGKALSCNQHACSKLCHAGSCGPCQEIVVLTCYCGNEKSEKLCTELQKSGAKASLKFSCDKICQKPLDCGNHQCADKCHPNPVCKSCKLLSVNIKTCPCGSTLIKKSLLTQRKSCTDPVPTCDNKCNKSLICGPEKNRHKCQKKCHTGPCPPCKLKTNAYCECKMSTTTIDCLQMYEKVVDGERVYFKPAEYSFSCETRCNKPKNCGRHRCNNKCCQFTKTQDNQLHKCDQICNKKLPCGTHNCPEPCHTGQCGDCTNIGWSELTCHCGGSVLYPPIPCGARPPACHRPCRRAHSCGHPVKHECHDDLEKCAPCIVFVNKKCFCGADSKDSVYCYLPGYSCGRTCKKELRCRQHTCKRVCHDGECEAPNQRGVIICNQTCPVPRFTCKHACGLQCHAKTPCPSSPCKRQVEVTCACGNKTERIECHKLSKDVDNKNKVAMMSSSRNNQDSIMIDLSKTTAASVSSQVEVDKKQLDCDESCSIYKRNKALAEALDIANPDLKPTMIFGEDPLRLLKEATAQDYKFVSATYNSLVKLIKLAKESEKRFIFMQFQPAEKLRREVVHELAHHFNCTSESQNEEPFRHVVVRAYKNKSSVPEFTIEQLLPVPDD